MNELFGVMAVNDRDLLERQMRIGEYACRNAKPRIFRESDRTLATWVKALAYFLFETLRYHDV